MDPLYQIARYVVGPKIEQKCTIVLLMYFKEENDFAEFFPCGCYWQKSGCIYSRGLR